MHFDNKILNLLFYSIELIITSFEFFACRCMPDSNPIYCETDFFKVKAIIENVLLAVEGCCNQLEQFRDNFYESKKKLI